MQEIKNVIVFTMLPARDGVSAYFNLAGKILTCFWCLMAVVLINAYSGTVTSFIMRPSFTPMVDSADDITALAPRPIVMADKSSFFEGSFTVLIAFEKESIILSPFN